MLGFASTKVTGITAGRERVPLRNRSVPYRNSSAWLAHALCDLKGGIFSHLFCLGVCGSPIRSFIGKQRPQRHRFSVRMRSHE
jgi:hypothetical protein